MKKVAYMIFAAGVTLSASAAIAGTAVPGNGIVDPAECELLSEQIRLNFSAGVNAAYNCNVATNTIRVGTCHEAGSRNPSVTCVQIGTNDDDEPIYNDDLCNAANVGQSVTVANGYRGFFAQTSGGSVGAVFLGDDCTAENVAGNAYLD